MSKNDKKLNCNMQLFCLIFNEFIEKELKLFKVKPFRIFNNCSFTCILTFAYQLEIYNRKDER